MRILLSVCSAVALLLSPAFAQAPTLDQVRELHAAYAKAREAAKTEMADAMKAARGAEKGSDEQKQLMAKITDIRKQVQSTQEAAFASFAKCEWTKFDVAKDGDLLKDCLPELVRDASDPKAAVKAGEFFLANFASDPAAGAMRGNALPMAMLAAGQFDGAKAMLKDAADAAEGSGKVRTMLTYGDVLAVGGDLEGARKVYAEAGDLADKNTKDYVTLRLELIGKPAPDIDSKTWVGGEAKPLSAMKGKVVLVDFWATWCPPCRMVMPGINELYKEHNAHGLEVIGVTKFYERGYMAKDASQMQAGGEPVQGLTEETFVPHVTEFRNNTGIAYPFVVAADSDFKNYKVRGIPTLAVVGKDGNIALITVGAGSEGLLKAAVANLLKAK